MATADIVRGEDATFRIKLRLPNQDPYDLTGVTNLRVMFRKYNGGFYEANSSDVPAQAAYATYEGVEYIADNDGALGNSILLQYNGVYDIDTVVGNWNTNNPSNTVSSDAADGSVVPPAGDVQLDQGFDVYKKVSIISPEVLGKLTVSLSDVDTNNLKPGNRLPIHVIIDKGTHPAGERRKVIIDAGVTVTESPL